MSLAQSYCGLGRAEAAAATIDELNSRAGAHRAVFGPQLRLLDAWLAAAQGDTRGAIAAAIDAADSARRCGQCAIEMLALHDAARFGGREWLQRLIDVAESVDGRLAPAHAAYGAALRDRDPVALCAASERFERLGAMLSAADASAQAAELFGRRDDRRRATEAAVRADRIAAAAGGMRSPALAAAATPLPLTSRERDVANLVAAGLTSREIAERLSLSARTVEGHVLHACTKLGVGDRKALAEFMRRGART